MYSEEALSFSASDDENLQAHRSLLQASQQGPAGLLPPLLPPPSAAAADLEQHRESPKPCTTAELLGRGKMVTMEVGGARRRPRGEEGHRRAQLAQQQPGASGAEAKSTRAEAEGGCTGC
jgi:hypothetical protein